MTRDDIIKLMRESCDTDKSEPWDNGFWTVTQEELERFAALLKKSVYENEDMFAEAYAGGYAAGAAAEREECAQICYGLAFETAGDEAEGMRQCAATIRARGEI